MENRNKTLQSHIYGRASRFGRGFLRVGRNWLTPALQEELDSTSPLDEVECQRAITRWLDRLMVIEVALYHFPTPRKGGPPIDSPGYIGAAAGFPAWNLIQERGTAGSPLLSLARQAGAGVADTPRSDYMARMCRNRDQNQCVVTGQKLSDGFDIQVAHVIPYHLAKNPQDRQVEFWKMLDLFCGAANTDTLFNEVHSKINGLENLVCLNVGVHSMFDHGTLTLRPSTFDGERLSIDSTYTGSYALTVNYPQGLSVPEHMQSTKISGISHIRPLYNNAQIEIQYRAHRDSQIRTVPRPSYFAIREWLLELNRLCRNEAQREFNEAHNQQ